MKRNLGSFPSNDRDVGPSRGSFWSERIALPLCMCVKVLSPLSVEQTRRRAERQVANSPTLERPINWLRRPWRQRLWRGTTERGIATFQNKCLFFSISHDLMTKSETFLKSPSWKLRRTSASSTLMKSDLKARDSLYLNLLVQFIGSIAVPKKLQFSFITSFLFP